MFKLTCSGDVVHWQAFFFFALNRMFVICAWTATVQCYSVQTFFSAYRLPKRRVGKPCDGCDRCPLAENSAPLSSGGLLVGVNSEDAQENGPQSITR